MAKNPKIPDAEVLAWACANLKVGCGLPMSVIENLAWEHFKDRWGDCRSGFGGKIRRLFPAHCSSFPHRLEGRPDLFAFEGDIPRGLHERCRGLWSLKPGAAAQLAQAA